MNTAVLKRVPPKPVGALLLHPPNSFFSKIVPYSLDGDTGSLAYSRLMPLAVPRMWQSVDQRRLVTGTHGVKCDTLVETSLVCAQSQWKRRGPRNRQGDTKAAIGKSVQVLSIRAYDTAARSLSVFSHRSDYYCDG